MMPVTPTDICEAAEQIAPLTGKKYVSTKQTILMDKDTVTLFTGCTFKPSDFIDPKLAKEVDSALKKFLQDPTISRDDRKKALEVLWAAKEEMKKEREKYAKSHSQLYSALDWILTIGKTLNESGMIFFLAHNEIVSVENRMNIIFANGNAIFYPGQPKSETSLEDCESEFAEYASNMAALKDENAKLNEVIAKLKATKDEGNKRADYWIRRFFPGSSSS